MSEPRTFTDDYGVVFIEAKPDDPTDPCSGCAFECSDEGCAAAPPCMEFVGEKLKIWTWKRNEST